MTNSTKPEILIAAIVIISDLFGVDSKSLHIDTLRSSVDGWDSLQHVNLVIDIERNFHIHLSEAQISSIRGIRDLVETIAEIRQRESNG